MLLLLMLVAVAQAGLQVCYYCESDDENPECQMTTSGAGSRTCYDIMGVCRTSGQDCWGSTGG